MNAEFLIYSYLIAMFIDWVCQFQWQAINKSKWNKTDNKLLSSFALISHSCMYGLLTWAALLALDIITFHEDIIVLFILIISHAIIDSRIPVKWIMKLKGMSEEEIQDHKNYGFMHIGIDHRLHEIVLVVLSLYV